MNKISINSEVFNVQGNNVNVSTFNGITTIKVDGKVVTTISDNNIKLEWTGDLANLSCTSASITGNIKGDVDCTNLKCNGDITGNIDATSVTANNINGDIDATSVSCKNNKGKY